MEMNIEVEKTPVKKRLKALKLQKSSSSSYMIGDSKIPPKQTNTVEKVINNSHSQNLKYNSSSSSIQ